MKRHSIVLSAVICMLTANLACRKPEPPPFTVA
jgi:hypothetical protein